MKEVPFLHTGSGKFNFLSFQACVSREKVQIMQGLEIVKKIYETRAFNIKKYHGENKYDIKGLRMAFLPGLLSIFTKDKNIHVIEGSI